MDTITQITLGAAVGEATLGRKVGNKAPLWGAVAGILPDLDVLAGPFLDDVSGIAFHRGFTHSITFALLFAPLFGYLLYRLFGGREAGWWDWCKLGFWAVVTHPLLDNFTSYGTQFFWPFSDYRIAFSSIFVIDPLYTVPFLITIIALLFYHRSSRKRLLLNYAGIAVSSTYLIFTVVNKLYVQQKFEESLNHQNISFSRIITSPTPLNNVLWKAVAEDSTGYWEGYFSLLDKTDHIEFEYYPRNQHLISHLAQEPQLRKLIWITNGFYTLSRHNGALYLNDMRYGRLNGWGKVEGEFVFSFLIQENETDYASSLSISRQRSSLDIDRIMLLRFANRLLGRTTG